MNFAIYAYDYSLFNTSKESIEGQGNWIIGCFEFDFNDFDSLKKHINDEGTLAGAIISASFCATEMLGKEQEILYYITDEQEEIVMEQIKGFAGDIIWFNPLKHKV